MAQTLQRQLKDGSARYDVRIRVNGRVVTRSFRTKRAASAWAHQIEADRLRGVAVDPRRGRVLRRDYAESWLTTRLVKGRPLSATTVQGYRGLLRRNILPHFGDTPLDAITGEAVRGWYAKLSADQAAKSYRLLRAILNTAVRATASAATPVDSRVLASSTPPSARWWTPASYSSWPTRSNLT